MQVPDIFYVEDNEDFCFFMENAFREVNDKLIFFYATEWKKGDNNIAYLYSAKT